MSTHLFGFLWPIATYYQNHCPEIMQELAESLCKVFCLINDPSAVILPAGHRTFNLIRSCIIPFQTMDVHMFSAMYYIFFPQNST